MTCQDIYGDRQLKTTDKSYLDKAECQNYKINASGD